MTTDLDVLVRQVARRDVDAFATFYDRTRARVFGLVIRVLRDPGESAQATEDVYLHVWRHADSYDPSAGSPLAWLLTLAHRCAVDQVRSKQVSPPRHAHYRAPHLDSAARRVTLHAPRPPAVDYLSSLNDTQRNCIELAYYDGLTYSQVSQRLSANLAMVKSQMRDAIGVLRGTRDTA